METMIDIRSEIRKADDNFVAAFARGDANALANYYTQDGMLLPTGSDFITGKKAIETFWQGVMDMGVKTARLEIVEVERQRDVAVEIGRYHLQGANGEHIDNGKYLVVWKQEGGTWKLHRDIWNTSIQPQT